MTEKPEYRVGLQIDESDLGELTCFEIDKQGHNACIRMFASVESDRMRVWPAELNRMLSLRAYLVQCLNHRDKLEGLVFHLQP